MQKNLKIAFYADSDYEEHRKQEPKREEQKSMEDLQDVPKFKSEA